MSDEGEDLDAFLDRIERQSEAPDSILASSSDEALTDPVEGETRLDSLVSVSEAGGSCVQEAENVGSTEGPSLTELLRQLADNPELPRLVHLLADLLESTDADRRSAG